ncbi:unnamed protein product [Nezara viridula]|uniref:Uncharacterized protein n=1 Tax=Nezara viridula TaxID=85310 RepID=A0A9P0EHJ9_NEZVI|nr:unnamed protein product [Nezara viridula]
MLMTSSRMDLLKEGRRHSQIVVVQRGKDSDLWLVKERKTTAAALKSTPVSASSRVCVCVCACVSRSCSLLRIDCPAKATVYLGFTFRIAGIRRCRTYGNPTYQITQKSV